MRSKAFLLGALLVLMTTFVATQGAQAKKPGSGTGSLPLTGTLPGGVTFTGTTSDLSASVYRTTGELLISGVLNGTPT